MKLSVEDLLPSTVYGLPSNHRLYFIMKRDGKIAPMKPSVLSGLLAGLGAASIWGGMYVVSKVVLEVIPPFALLTWRLLLGMVSLGLVFAWRRRPAPDSRQFLSIFATGFIGYGVSIGFQFVGTKLSTAANGALITSSTPLFVLLFAALLLREPITLRRLLALLLASLGVILVIDPRGASISSELFLGNLSLVAAGITWALYSVLVRKVTRETDVLTTSLIAFAGGLPLTLPLGLWEILSQGVGPITWGVVGGILFLGIISTAVAMYLWNIAFALLDAGLASLTFFAQPLAGTLLSAIFLGERITPAFVLGGILIGLGLLIATQPNNR